MTTKPDLAEMAAADPRIAEIMQREQVRWSNDIRYLLTRLAEAHEAIRDLLDCGIESDEPSLRYITVQIDRPSWKQAQDIIAGKPE